MGRVLETMVPVLLAATAAVGTAAMSLGAGDAAAQTTDRVDTGFEFALIWGARTGDMDMVRSRIDDGANINASDEAGMNALHWSIAEGHTAVAEWLLVAGADVHSRDRVGHAALHFAALSRDARLARLLIKAGAETDPVTDMGMTPLYLAAMNGDEVTVSFLVRQGADIEARDVNDLRPLHAAVMAAWLGATRVLLEAGADPNGATNEGVSPLDLAAAGEGFVRTMFRESLPAAGLLRTDAIPELSVKSNDHYAAVADALLISGADPNRACAAGATPLHWAAMFDSAPQALVLLAKGADQHARFGGRSPLELAVQQGHASIAEVLRATQTSDQ